MDKIVSGNLRFFLPKFIFKFFTLLILAVKGEQILDYFLECSPNFNDSI